MYLLAFAESIQLFPDGTIFIHIALILLMIWVLNRTFFKPINRVIETREKHKGGRGGEAESIVKEAEEKQTRVTQALLDARSQGYELIEKERSEAVVRHQEKIAAAKAETAQRLADEKRQLEQQTAEARATIEAEAEKLSDRISENILRV